MEALLCGHYFDYNATTPLDSTVNAAVTLAMQQFWGNPSSSYELGATAAASIARARESVAKLLFAEPSDLVFTSGGTEANHLAIHSALVRFNSQSCCNGASTVIAHVITSTIEHPSVSVPLRYLEEQRSIELTLVPVSHVTGCVSPADVLDAIRPNTCLVTIILAQNETGIIQPVAEIGRRLAGLRRRNDPSARQRVFFHSDAAQAVGKVPVDVNELGVDFLTVVGHKFYGPRVGALVARGLRDDPEMVSPMFRGGGQEGGYRSGTENTPMICGLGQAARLVQDRLKADIEHIGSLRSSLVTQLKDNFKVKVHFENVAGCLPNTCSVAFCSSSLTGAKIVERLACASPPVYASSGAACHSGSSKASTVLLNSGVSERLALRTVRFSVGRLTDHSSIDTLMEKLREILIPSTSEV